jgi:NTP pyrophosphatase (non-canonical NTP hydrolase)
MFHQIEQYHKELGYLRAWDTDEQRIQAIRNKGLALYQEVGELIDSFPWKPWRNMCDQTHDTDNATREIIDIIFFLVAICEDAGITPLELEVKFSEVLQNNYARLDNGYSKKGGD